MIWMAEKEKNSQSKFSKSIENVNYLIGCEIPLCLSKSIALHFQIFFLIAVAHSQTITG